MRAEKVATIWAWDVGGMGSATNNQIEARKNKDCVNVTLTVPKGPKTKGRLSMTVPMSQLKAMVEWLEAGV